MTHAATDAPNLNPAEVAALATQLHDLTCRVVWSTDDPLTRDDRHRELDHGRARFVLHGLHQAGWNLTPAT